MAKNALWSDEYWLLLMRLYLRKPEGVKPMYSKEMVKLALELHIPPQFLYEQMFRLRQLDTPRLERLWETYSKNPNKLARGIKKLRQMKGWRDELFDGVEIIESWELDFKPLPVHTGIMPITLIIILDQYFRLTPITMVKDTPEIQELAKLLKLKPELIVEIMEIFQLCDPYLNKDMMIVDDLLHPCQQIWKRYGNDNPQKLAAYAAQLKEFFK
ncbi:MAG: hypothetical protein IJK09_05635 [Prevotella sp.]|nr:hypothetical protein [Prevotella sp.]MBQ4446662.1 hypothetical protein [Prevotella sp.]MBQ6309033.1 hypothetical protein [Prevotella sp.]MBQ6657688.1 hypothetical protein [Prevotella sp.]MBQ9570183.1 hypothetical protein [Prevotella sp.]